MVITENLTIVLNESKLIIPQLAGSLIPYTDFKNNYAELLARNKVKLDNCSRSWYITLKQHIATGKEIIEHRPLACSQRNCMFCYNVRRDRIKSRLRPLWDSIPARTPTTHLWLTFPHVPLNDMSRTLFKFMRSKARLFLRKLRGIHYRQWGFGVWELKYVPELHAIHPHFHLVMFSYCIPIGSAGDTWNPDKPTIRGIWHDVNKNNYNDPALKGLWYGIQGNSYIADGKYSPKKKPGEKPEAHIKRLNARKYAILDYFARRVAYAGLITAKEKDKEIPIDRIPDEIFINCIHGSRLYFAFGPTTTYWIADKKKPWIMSMKRTPDYYLKRRTNIPQGILQLCAQRVREIEDSKAEYREFFLGTFDTGHLIRDSDHPPDWALDIKAITEAFNEIYDSEGDTRTEEVCWVMAFRQIAEEHGFYDGKNEEVEPEDKEGLSQASLGGFA